MPNLKIKWNHIDAEECEEVKKMITKLRIKRKEEGRKLTCKYGPAKRSRASNLRIKWSDLDEEEIEEVKKMIAKLRMKRQKEGRKLTYKYGPAKRGEAQTT